PLSRFENACKTSESNPLLIILSGPEPQRSLFEELVAEQLVGLKQEATLVRGLPGETTVLDLPGYIKQYNHLGAAELQSETEKASYVICRAGYSSVMDLLKMHKKCIMVPTPGQTEQEYLANHLMQQQYAFTVDQEKFRLKPILDLVKYFPYKTPGISKENNLHTVISSFLQRIQKT
ncbi:MAG TPA: glycosyltransferase, partial [Chitinophagaceae bacterium]